MEAKAKEAPHVLEKKGSHLQWIMAVFVAFGVILAFFMALSVYLYLRGIDLTLVPVFSFGGGAALAFLCAWLTLRVMRGREFIVL
jgi:hypothetical protein